MNILLRLNMCKIVAKEGLTILMLTMGVAPLLIFVALFLY